MTFCDKAEDNQNPQPKPNQPTKQIKTKTKQVKTITA